MWRKAAEPKLTDPTSLIRALPEDSGWDGQLIPVEGVANFRDLGGYFTTEGRRVRTGQVYRSGGLDRITEAGRAQLHALGVRLVCDLRTPGEAHREPDAGLNGVQYRHIPIAEDNPARVFWMLIFRRRAVAELLVQAYKSDLIDAGAPRFGQVFRLMAEPDNRPLLIHCTAGKDRTGLAAALLLALLGVPEPVILADYSLSNRFYDQFLARLAPDLERARRLGVDEAMAQPALLADPAVLAAVFEHMQEVYGGVEAYLRSAAGLDAVTLNNLKEGLLI